MADFKNSSSEGWSDISESCESCLCKVSLGFLLVLKKIVGLFTSYRNSMSFTKFHMPSTDTKQDPRLVELAAVNSRLKTVLSFLKTKHTAESLDNVIQTSRNGLGDHSPAFVHVENTAVTGTRHLKSLLELTEALEIKAEIGEADHALDECRKLLEKKVALLTELTAAALG